MCNLDVYIPSQMRWCIHGQVLRRRAASGKDDRQQRRHWRHVFRPGYHPGHSCCVPGTGRSHGVHVCRVSATSQLCPYQVGNTINVISSMGVDRWGTGGDTSPHFSARWGPHRKCPPPTFLLKKSKISCVFIFF